MQSSGEGYERGSCCKSQDIAKGHGKTPVSELTGILARSYNRDVTKTTVRHSVLLSPTALAHDARMICLARGRSHEGAYYD
jgi:hypothetical protein